LAIADCEFWIFDFGGAKTGEGAERAEEGESKTMKDTLAAVRRTADLASQPAVRRAEHGHVTGQAKSTKEKAAGQTGWTGSGRAKVGEGIRLLCDLCVL